MSSISPAAGERPTVTRPFDTTSKPRDEDRRYRHPIRSIPCIYLSQLVMLPTARNLTLYFGVGRCIAVEIRRPYAFMPLMPSYLHTLMLSYPQNPSPPSPNPSLRFQPPLLVPPPTPTPDRFATSTPSPQTQKHHSAKYPTYQSSPHRDQRTRQRQHHHHLLLLRLQLLLLPLLHARTHQAHHPQR